MTNTLDLVDEILRESSSPSQRKKPTSKTTTKVAQKKTVLPPKKQASKIKTVLPDLDILDDISTENIMANRSPRIEDLERAHVVDKDEDVVDKDEDVPETRLRDFVGTMKKLEDLGFNPQERILLRDHKTRCMYIKAVTRYGQLFLVDVSDVSDKGDVSDEKGDARIFTQSKESLVPYSTIHGLLSCIELSISAIAFEDVQHTSITIVSRNVNGDIDQLSLIAKGAGATGEMFSTYPVVHFDEVKTYPEQINTNIDETYKQIYIINQEVGQRAMETLKDVSQNVFIMAKRYIGEYYTAGDEVSASLEKLHILNTGYGDITSLSEEDQTKFNLLRLNEQKRYEILNQMMFSITIVDNQVASMNSLAITLEEGIKYLKEQVDNCNFVLYK